MPCGAGPRQRSRKGCVFGGPFGTIRAPAGAPRAWAPVPWSKRILRDTHHDCAGLSDQEEEFFISMLIRTSY
jgi:hypothetical protein